MVIVEFFAINTVTNDGNVGIRCFKLAKKKSYLNGSQPDDHWNKSLMLILLS